jgi:nucleotide-binding universal stress UspA family protein
MKRMLTVRTILAATDFSGCADAAVDLALHVARRHGASLRLLHVEEAGEPPRQEFGGLHPLSRAWENDLVGSVRPEEIHMVWDDVPIVAEVRSGIEATDAILDAVASYDVDLLVMGTHGQHSVRRFLNDTPDAWSIGLTAREVLSETRCPVLAVGPRHDHPVGPPQVVVAGVDDSPLADEVLTNAAALASFYGTPLIIVHVVPYGTDPARITDMRRDLVARAKALIRDTVPFEVHMPEGRPAESLVRLVRHRPGALLVVASHGHRTRGSVRIGSVADAVVRSAPCPVITIKPYGKSLVTPDPEVESRLARVAARLPGAATARPA